MDEPREPDPMPGGSGDGASEPRPAAEPFPGAADWRWVHAERQKPNQGVFELYEGLTVAVVGGRVVGAAAPGPNTMTLRERVAERCAVDPNRVVMIGLEDPFFIQVG